VKAADLHRIQSYLRVAAPRWRDHMRIGPFLATFSRDTDNRYLNYAIPDDDADPSPRDVDALVAAYRERNRMPRLEYVPAVAPAVEPALVAGGFSVEARTPLMIYTGGGAPRSVAGIELVAPESDDDLRGAATAQWEAYDEAGPVAERAVESLRRTVDAGGIVVLARDAATRKPAGAGTCTAPTAGTSELTSVGVRACFRRRGIAQAMAHWLAEQIATRDVDCVFLMAESEREERIYARAGFETVSEVLHISLTTA
jgi:ribosomal protein S18 acetylase RimI-like enzyme